MKLEKDITFIYMDSSEKAMYMPIYNEAKKRGYRVKLTTNMFEKCEIGFYCQHVNLPQFSKFSIIMLHDIIQQSVGRKLETMRKVVLCSSPFGRISCRMAKSRYNQ